MSNFGKKHVRLEGSRLFLDQGNYWLDFDRDCCMILENRFFATEKGIEFDNKGLEIMRQAQPHVYRIDAYAVFGRMAEGKANELRGRFLKIELAVIRPCKGKSVKKWQTRHMEP